MGDEQRGIGIGIAGMGRMGRQYLRSMQYLEGAFLRAIYSPDISEESLQAHRIYRDFDAMLNDPEIDAVIIATPSHTHAQMAIQAAEHGKHILVEKPMALSPLEGEQMVDICGQLKVVLMVSFIERFNPVFREVKKILSDMKLGRIRSFNCKRRTKSAHRPQWYWNQQKSGGIFIDLMGHDVDLLRWLLNDEIQQVIGIHQRGKEESGAKFEFGLALINFTTGIIGSIESNWNLPESFPAWGDITLEILSSEGMIHVNTGANQPIIFSSSESSVSFIHDEESNRWMSVDLGRKDAILTMLNNFIGAIRGENKVAVSGEDGLRALFVTHAAAESAETGKPIKLSQGIRL